MSAAAAAAAAAASAAAAAAAHTLVSCHLCMIEPLPLPCPLRIDLSSAYYLSLMHSISVCVFYVCFVLFFFMYAFWFGFCSSHDFFINLLQARIESVIDNVVSLHWAQRVVVFRGVIFSTFAFDNSFRDDLDLYLFDFGVDGETNTNLTVNAVK